MGRRERLRADTRDEIKLLARQHMAESGSAAISLHAIARAMGMVPSALYRYYPDREALITALIGDAFHAMAAAVAQADARLPRAAFGDRIMAACMAYRAYALAQPIDFQLLFGNPLPDYSCPPELSGEGAARIFGVFLNALQDAHAAGALRPTPGFSAGALAAQPPGSPLARYAPEVVYAGVAGWLRMQGAVTLELFGQLQPTIADAEALYRAEMWALLIAHGIPPSDSPDLERGVAGA